MLISKNKPPQAAAQTAELPESGEGTGGKADRTSPHCLSESEFAGVCAERVEKSRRVRVCAAAVGCRAGTARVLFFCERFLLHIKRKCSRITINFILTATWKTSEPSRFIHQVSGGMGKLRSLAEKTSNPVVTIHESPVKPHNKKRY